MCKVSPDTNDLHYKLTLSMLFESKPTLFDSKQFEYVVESALKTILGEVGLGKVVDFAELSETNCFEGSLIIRAEDLHIVWSALSIYGQHKANRLRISIKSVHKIMECCAQLILLAVVFLPLLAACIVSVLFLRRPKKLAPNELRGKHVLITGGSKGIGRALASEFVSLGCCVTIVARDKVALEKASQELSSKCTAATDGQKVHWISVDVTRLYSSVQNMFAEAESVTGKPIDILVNNAGGSVQGPFDLLPIEAFEDQMRLNYLSSVYVTRAWVERVKSRKTEKRLVFVSSIAGLTGVFGYSAYCPSKFALRGFAESLQAELKPYGFTVTMVFPPNTDTEGFKEELKSMPRETELISGSAGLFKPEDVAHCVVSAICNGTFMCNIGLDGWLIGNLTAGMAPAVSALEVLTQICVMGPSRLVALFVLNGFDKVIEKCKLEREKTK